jgi:purine-cytosine permease-like protein
MEIIKEKSIYSMRKIATVVILLVFLVACLGYLIQHKFAELPNSYIIIIGTVFGFYFAKDVIRNVKIKTEEDAKVL